MLAFCSIVLGFCITSRLKNQRKIMQQRLLLLLCSSLLFAFAVKAKDHFDPRSYASENVITRDVAVVGGGASGTFSAINLRRLGKSVFLIERDAELGGHTNTYTDPSTGVSINYGTQAFWNSMSSNVLLVFFAVRKRHSVVFDLNVPDIRTTSEECIYTIADFCLPAVSVARDYFAHLNITFKRPTFAPLTTVYADFQTGQQVTVQSSTNLTTYAEQLQKYPYLLYSWNLPSPVPEDLFLPFAAFIAKYDLRDVAFSIFSAGRGFTNILEQLTVNVMKMVDESYIQSVAGDSIVPQDNNGEIYTQAVAHLGQDVLLSSIVVAAQRSSNSNSSVRLVVKTPLDESSSKLRSC